MSPSITIPADLLPADGRFGCGPSKVPAGAVEALAKQASTYLGTSHRQANVRFMVSRLRNGLAELLALPDGYEVVLGDGGTTVLWDALTFGVIRQRSLHLSFGEFSSKFAACSAAAPHLGDPVVVESAPGTRPALAPSSDGPVDAYAYPHNETSTGVWAPVGFDGDTNNRIFVRAVRAASSWSTVTRKPVEPSVGRTTGTPPARRMGSG